MRIGAGLLAISIGLFAGLSIAITGAALAVGAILLFTLLRISTSLRHPGVKK
ncbi:MAG: hypothetical protein KF722_16505 [Nitrospira sp.]|nr:hypothetical protein [Nitrospira sp.]